MNPSLILSVTLQLAKTTMCTVLAVHREKKYIFYAFLSRNSLAMAISTSAFVFLADSLRLIAFASAPLFIFNAARRLLTRCAELQILPELSLNELRFSLLLLDVWAPTALPNFTVVSATEESVSSSVRPAQVDPK